MPERLLYDEGQLRKLLDDLSELRMRILRSSDYPSDFAAIEAAVGDPDDRDSILNLRHYLAFRSEDLRPLQERLSTIGLSSLGRSEVHVIDAIERVLNLLQRLLLPDQPPVGMSRRAISLDEGCRLLTRNTERLLGPSPVGRKVRIMVTLPSEAAHDYGLIYKLAERGMDVARINCAHDSVDDWLQMIRHVRRAAAELGRPLTVSVDLAGHKIRTGPLAVEAGVLHMTPKRDRFGRVLAPVRLRLQRPAGQEAEAPRAWQANQAGLLWDKGQEVELQPGDRLRFVDSRGAKRTAVIDTVDGEGAWANLHHATYLSNDISWRWERDGEKWRRHGVFSGIADTPVAIVLRQGDLLLLTREPLPGQVQPVESSGMPVAVARISCAMPEIFEVLRVGQQLWIDDGKFGAEVAELSEAGALLKINNCRPGGAKLLADKGLNFPGLELGLPGLAQHDLTALKALVGKVDIINFSYVETAAHVHELLATLERLKAEKVGIIAKIETAQAFNNLAEIALAAMGRLPFGIMIARGDLAMEVGPERLAEVQEEILWLAEAAHLPVVWATQVLESMAKKGVVSRPELTDAAMGERAECVMLNKGPFIEKALTSLHNILSRMQEHQRKKSPRLRALRWGRAAGMPENNGSG